MALNSLYCADVPLSNYSLTVSISVFLGLSVLDLDPMYERDRRQMGIIA